MKKKIEELCMTGLLRSRYFRLPENVRMIMTAILGAFIGLLTYEIIYYFVRWEPRATISWLTAFLINIARQHTLHRLLTFTHHTPYWKSLGRAYVMYSGSTALGAGVNYLLTRELDVHHRLAWLCCLLITASISLIFLKKYVFKPETAAKAN